MNATAYLFSLKDYSPPRQRLFNVNYAVLDYSEASDLIINKALAGKSYGVSALAVHGLIESVSNVEFRENLDKIDMIVPDGQPVRWALNHFRNTGLKDRVAGPILTKHVLAKADKLGLRVYLYGSTLPTLQKIEQHFKKKYPNITICGYHVDRFRDATDEEDQQDIEKINASKSHLVLVGRGCPRQEKWVANHVGKIDSPMMAIGAAFDFMAGNIKHAPHWMQKAGLEWFYRLVQNPKKLWKRYLVTNSYFVYLIILCKLGIKKF
jgi:exopolysaccharide biosynthesis WecB/TagA/CpsF family protein